MCFPDVMTSNKWRETNVGGIFIYIKIPLEVTRGLWRNVSKLKEIKGVEDLGRQSKEKCYSCLPVSDQSHL